MKIAALFSFCLLFIGLGHNAVADDFGARFMQSSPAALEDTQPAADPFAGIEMPYDIEPAAGDEAESEVIIEDQVMEPPADDLLTPSISEGNPEVSK